MHCEFKSRIHADQHVSKNKFAVAPDPDAHKGFIADTITKRIFRTHVNVPQRADYSTIDLDAAFRTLKHATGRIRYVAAFADRWSNAQFELLRHCNLDLRAFARGPKDPD